MTNAYDVITTLDNKNNLFKKIMYVVGENLKLYFDPKILLCKSIPDGSIPCIRIESDYGNVNVYLATESNDSKCNNVIGCCNINAYVTDLDVKKINVYSLNGDIITTDQYQSMVESGLDKHVDKKIVEHKLEPVMYWCVDHNYMDGHISMPVKYGDSLLNNIGYVDVFLVASKYNAGMNIGHSRSLFTTDMQETINNIHEIVDFYNVNGRLNVDFCDAELRNYIRDSESKFEL